MQQYNYDQIYGDVINSPHNPSSLKISNKIPSQRQQPHQSQIYKPTKPNQPQQIHKTQLYSNSHANSHSNSHSNSHLSDQCSDHNNYHGSDQKSVIFSHEGLSIGRPTKSKKSEIYQSKAPLEANHTHPNHKKYNTNDPFHGTRNIGDKINGGIQRKMMRNEGMNKYQMDPRRTKQDMNPNAQYMFNSHNEQIKQNEYSKMSTSEHIEPTYYDQTQYSGLETDRMFLAEAKDISNQYADASSDISDRYGHHMEQMQTQSLNNRNPVLPLSVDKNESQQYKQKRSYRNPHEAVDSNSKLWEYQFTPMTTPQ